MGALAILLCAGGLLAQYALDANLQVGGGRVNPSSGHVPLGRDIYRVNRRTGTFQYDENAAFWGPRTYNVRTQESLMRSGVMDSYARPVLTTGPDSGLYTLDRRTGNFRYNRANAFESQRYNVYQSAAPPPTPKEPIEIGDSKPVYRPVRRSGGKPRGARQATRRFPSRVRLGIRWSAHPPAARRGMRHGRRDTSRT